MTIVIPEIYHDLPGTCSELRPRLPSVPALLSLRIGFLQGRHATRACHWSRRSSTRTSADFRSAAGLVDPADLPLADEDGVVRPVLVDPRAEAGRAELRSTIKKRTPGRGVQSSAGGLFMEQEPLGGHSLSKLISRRNGSPLS